MNVFSSSFARFLVNRSIFQNINEHLWWNECVVRNICTEIANIEYCSRSALYMSSSMFNLNMYNEIEMPYISVWLKHPIELLITFEIISMRIHEFLSRMYADFLMFLTQCYIFSENKSLLTFIFAKRLKFTD